MSSGCGDVLSLTDLQAAKKHQLFEAEVITGKQGGVASGTDIDYATNQVTGQVQKTLPAILRDIGFDPAAFDFTTGGTLGVNDRNKVVYDPVSQTWYSWAGTLPHVIAAGTNPVGDANWKPQTDPNLRDELAGETVGKGAYMIGTDHRGTLKKDLDAFDVRTSGQDLATLIANSSDIYLDTVESGTPVAINYTAKIEGGAGGKITPIAKGINGLVINSGGTDTRVHDVVIEGDGTVAASDTVATAGVVISADGATMEGGVIKNLSMGCSVATGVKGTKLIGNHYENMVAHASLGVGGGGAGGYGVLMQGAEDVLILGQNSYGVNPNDRHAVYLSENASNLAQNKAVRIIGLRSDYSGAVNGGQKEQTAPAIFGRGCLGIIIADTQIANSGSGIAFTDERQVFENISINNVQLENITATDSVNYDSVGIRLQSYAGRSNIRGNIDNITLRMINRGSNTGVRTFPIDVSGFRFLNISNIMCASTGLNPVIRLANTRDVNISNITSLIIDGTDTANAAALISFVGVCSGINVSNLNKGGTRAAYFSGLNNVTDLKVDFPRKATVNSASGTITTVDGNELIESVSITGTGQITVTFKNHVTTLAVEGCQVTSNNTTGALVTATTSGRSIVVTLYNSSGTPVPLSGSTVNFSLVLSC